MKKNMNTNLLIFNENKVKEVNISDTTQLVAFFSESGSYHLKINLLNEKTDAEILILVIGQQKNKIELSTIQSHRSRNTKSHLQIKSVLSDHAEFIYQGLIKIEKGAVNSDAFLKNENLLLSDNCHLESQPNLEILEDETRCSHAVTTGSPNPEQMFYLLSRGLSQPAMQNLIVSGFVSDLLTGIEDKKIQEQITQQTQNLLEINEK